LRVALGQESYLLLKKLNNLIKSDRPITVYVQLLELLKELNLNLLVFSLLNYHVLSMCSLTLCLLKHASIWGLIVDLTLAWPLP
jgi:hypothetical protein